MSRAWPIDGHAVARVKGRVAGSRTLTAAAGTRVERQGEALPTRSMARTSTVPPGRAGSDHGASPTGPRMRQGGADLDGLKAGQRIAGAGPDRHGNPAPGCPRHGPAARLADQNRLRLVRPRAAEDRRGSIELHRVGAVEAGQEVAAGAQEAREHPPRPVGPAIVEPPGDAAPQRHRDRPGEIGGVRQLRPHGARGPADLDRHLRSRDEPRAPVDLDPGDLVVRGAPAPPRRSPGRFPWHPRRRSPPGRPGRRPRPRRDGPPRARRRLRRRRSSTGTSGAHPRGRTTRRRRSSRARRPPPERPAGRSGPAARWRAPTWRRQPPSPPRRP